MQCGQCGRRALYGAQEAGDRTIPLCLQCYLVWTQIKASQVDALTRQANILVGQMEFTGGLAPGALPRLPERNVVQVKDVTLNNIRIDNSTIGVINTGHIGAVDAAVTVLRQGGAGSLADAFKELTESVAGAPDLAEDRKAEVIELLSAISTEAVAPPAERRRAVVMPLLERAAALVGGAASLAELWERVRPLIHAAFK